MDANKEIHSVILNLNKNFSNNKAFDFTTIVNKQLALKPNSMVALYTGNIVRKPIVLNDGASLELIFKQTVDNRMEETIVGNQFYKNVNSSTIIDIDKGEYSKLAFCKFLCNNVNETLAAFDYSEASFDVVGNGQNLYSAIPYRMVYSMRNGEFFVGLRYKCPQQQDQLIVGSSDILDPNWFLTTILDLDDGCTTSNGVSITGGNSGNPNMLTFHRTSRSNDWDAFALGNSGMRPMASMLPDNQSEYTSESLIEDISFSTINLRGIKPGAGTQSQEMFWGLNSTYFSSSWAQSGVTVGLDTLPLTGASVPQALIGAYFDLTADSTDGYTNQSVFITINRQLHKLELNDFKGQTERDAIIAEGQKIVAEIDLKEYGVDLQTNTEFKWVLYSALTPIEGLFNPSTNLLDGSVKSSRVYFFRLQVVSPYEQGINAVLFDSRNYGISIPEDVVELGCGFQGIPNPDDGTKFVSAGLCPQYYFKNTNEDLEVSNPMGNYVTGAYTDSTNNRNLVLFTGMRSYEFDVKNTNQGGRFKNQTELQSILGVGPNQNEDDDFAYTKTNFDPNVFPLQREEGGVTQLGSDRTRYNIELNLPLSAYNSTESNANDIGQKRAILYHTNPIVEDVTNVSSGLVNKNIEPNTLKYLSLNNQAQIKLNTIDIKIRRAKSNELADEITDCTIELLIQN